MECANDNGESHKRLVVFLITISTFSYLLTLTGTLINTRPNTVCLIRPF